MSKGKTVYPVVLSPAKEGGYCVYVPDMDTNTQGEDLADAIDMAQDSIEMMGVYLEDIGKPVPIPSSVDSVKHNVTDIVTLVPADFEAYRRKTEKKVVKKTLSIPSWLNVEAEDAGVNFSATLQDALKARLGVE